MSPLLSIFIYAVLSGLATLFIAYFTTLQNNKKVLFNSFVLFVLTCILAYTNFRFGKDAQAQSDKIEDSVNVATKISELDTEIDNKTQVLVLKNNSLTDSVHKLIQEVDNITSSIHKETSEEIAENTLTGKLDFHLKKTLPDDESSPKICSDLN